MQARIKPPALTLPGARDAIRALNKTTEQSGVARTTLELVNIRVGQINGCSVCVDMHCRMLEKLGEKPSRIFAIGTWRETTYFTDAERAALALAEAETRLADRGDAVPDDVWNEAARHYNEAQLGALVMSIGVANLWNRLNVATRQVSGDHIAAYVDQLMKGE